MIYLDLYSFLQLLNSETSLKLKDARSLTILISRLPLYKYVIKGKTRYTGSNDELIRLAKMGINAESTGEIEKVMNFQINQYSRRKPSGGYRKITSYDEPLKNLLKGFLDVLSPIMEKDLPVELVGCRKKISISDICQDISDNMKDNTVICHVDVVKWFDYIRTDHVKKVLDNYFCSYPSPTDGKLISTSSILAEIMTYRGRLPQGSPTSPLLANCVANITWAPKVIEYCRNNGLFLRIYVDNIIFTFNGLIIDASKHIQAIKDILSSQNFKGHKEYISAPYRKQKILGLILNKPYLPRVPKKLKKKIGTILYKGESLFKEGSDRLPIILEWGSKYDGIEEMRIIDRKELSPEEKEALLRKRFYEWIMGQVSYIGSNPSDKKLEIGYKESVQRVFNPKRII